MNDHLLPVHSAPELAAVQLPPRETILDPILANDSLALLYGPRGLGKTFVALGIARAAAAGESFLGWRATRPHRVLFVDGEMSAIDMQQRLALFGPPPPSLDFMLAHFNRGRSLDLSHHESHRRLMMSWDNPELVVLDNLASLAGFRSGDADRWHELQRFLVVQRQLGRAVLMVHHANKRGLQRGSSRREDLLDLVLAMRRPPEWLPGDATSFEIHFEKARRLHSADVAPIEVRMEDDAASNCLRWHWQPIGDPVFDRAVALFECGTGAGDGARAMGISRASAYRLRERAVRLKRLPALS